MITEHLIANNPDHLARAGELLKTGELVAVPTETVYGLAADASQPDAVAKIFTAKQRPSDHPLIVHLPEATHISSWAINIPSTVKPLIKHFWPGPLTLLLDKHPQVSPVVTGGLPSIGVRIPSQNILLQLLQQFNLAVAAPSANPYQKLSPTTAEHVLDNMDGKISAVLDDGPCTVGTESTILRLHHDHGEILRSGPISAKAIEDVLQLPVNTPTKHDESVSGNKEVHYCPNARVRILSTEDLMQETLPANKKIAVLTYSIPLSILTGKSFAECKNLTNSHSTYRHDFYAALHTLDKKLIDEIWVEAPPLTQEWLDIWDRLKRAAFT